ncbi:MAG: Hpt domain-containing protein [Hyphomonadaceae bacterium]|nr:Hpt domain-containing protein [Hyphomonadaceae bacterium]MBX3511919.1 Hpt domain-containing protein [Hyphomonadaceae bacterium]
MSKAKAQFIDPREHGARFLDLRQPVFDSDAVARADQTLSAMSASFQQWLDADILRLQNARQAAEEAAWSNPALNELWGVAHELKGMGGSYGYPLVTEIAASLCRLIETDSGKRAAQQAPGLVAAHVDALRAIARDKIQTGEHPIGRALSQTLAAQVERLGVAPR